MAPLLIESPDASLEMNTKYSRSSRKDRIFRYQMRIYEAEMIELRLQKEAILHKIGLPIDSTSESVPNIPSIYRFVTKPHILAFLERCQELFWTLRSLKSGFKKAGTSAPDTQCVAIAQAARQSAARDPAPGPQNARLYVDITSTLRGNMGGGIERVCRRIAAELHSTSVAKPVAIFDGRLMTLDPHGLAIADVQLSRHDTYLILDSFWEPLEDYLASLDRARRTGARTALCIYDVIPLQYPGLVNEGIPEWFEQRLRTILPLVDVIVSISRSSARQIRIALRRLGMKRRVVSFHLGYDSFNPDPDLARVPVGQPPFHFTSIGTLEPKKGYDCALDAFDALWHDGQDVRYTIIGRPGWACTALIHRICQHPEFGKRLNWVKGASDDDVHAHLARSYCYIQASIAEGFGLPVVEAAHLGVPVIASGLPVFREIAGDNILYSRYATAKPWRP